MKYLFAISVLAALIGSTVASADTLKCAWIGNSRLILVSANSVWPGHSLENTKLTDFRSAPIRLRSKSLPAENLTSGRFKGHVSFTYYTTETRSLGGRIILPADFYEGEEEFVAYLSNMSGSRFDSLVCRMTYAE